MVVWSGGGGGGRDGAGGDGSPGSQVSLPHKFNIARLGLDTWRSEAGGEVGAGGMGAGPRLLYRMPSSNVMSVLYNSKLAAGEPALRRPAIWVGQHKADRRPSWGCAEICFRLG